ncbi:glycosyl transferase [Sphingobium sp. SCG-1]|uniref:glycosyltransferase family 4 protein n=1 Tax=Sphingobium sp. SCG-1 TaxID=2072936 RepID=UPI000CD6AFC4|nr:glycosyltransferase family 4 protein [Sphingobium sp. SCG-1]AUW59849.1 glycosyl transferase [Sphingobium sp. SCG-1]
MNSAIMDRDTFDKSRADQLNVALIHPFDPRGGKVGGIETFVRDYITYHPDDMNLLLIGVDGFGDLELGKVTQISFRGRTISFFPVMKLPETETNVYARKLSDAVTMRFTLACLRNYFALRSILRKGGYSIDLRRIELAPLGAAFGVPSVQMLHDGMVKGKQMSSLLKRFWWIKDLSERFSLSRAYSFYCVNDDLSARLKTTYPQHAEKIGTLPTWANPQIFKTTPIPPLIDDALHVGYTGRMDDFKRPDIMFQVIAQARRMCPGLVFHYVGDGDVERFSEFDAIRDCTVLHGRQDTEGLAAILAKLHVGLLTSDFEGMPRSVMEFLASGRPVVALHLPQLEAVIHDERSGYLVPRGPDQIVRMAERLCDMRERIAQGAVTTEQVADAVADYSPARLLGRLYSDHRKLQAARRQLARA